MTHNRPKDLHNSLKNIDSANHVSGKSIYVDDIPEQRGTLYACVYGSPIAHGKIRSIDLTKALSLSGVVRILQASDIPGQNEIGGIIQDEPLLAEGAVHFNGQPIALVLAESEAIAQEAASLINAEFDPLPVITDPRVAYAKGEIIGSPRCFKNGDPAEAFKRCTHIFEGQAESGGQEHLYIESQGAYAYPMENGSIRISSSTQGPTAVQRITARVLGLSMHKIEVDVTRLGGGFGGKEDQATPWAALAALGVFHLHRPVKYVLHRLEDMRMTGKRNPYSSDFKIGLDEELRIIAFEATYYQNAGAAADLSPAILGRTLFHCNNSYYLPNVKATAYSCRTNLPPNTAFRGFGGPQGMFVIESAITHAAEQLGIDSHIIQQKNLLHEGNEFPYGQIAEGCEAKACWQQAIDRYDLDKVKTEVAEFNKKNDLFKKGLALMPVCFGISFTNTQMNNARALVHIYSDGSVGISTGAVEMGQGVNTKMLQVAARHFGLSPEQIKIETTNTTRVANTSPSAASATADLNGKALSQACQQLLDRLLPLAAELLELDTSDGLQLYQGSVCQEQQATDLSWSKLIHEAFMRRLNLSAKGHYATPRIQFDRKEEKGHPFAYHVYGTALVTATVDCIRGRYTLDAVQVVHDYGASMNRAIDLGQTEGGIVQGIGWMTMEELLYNEEGRLLSNALSTYKIPDIYAVPKTIDVHFLKTDHDNLAILRSKAVGEPPLMYGIGAYFAIRSAVRAFNPDWRGAFSAPITPEKVLMGLYG